MNEQPIGIFDSGIGGISILKQLEKTLPHENFIYYADSYHNPYGDKTLDELKKIVNEIMEKFVREQVKMVVVACNTATTKLIDYLRESYPEILFVGTEPAIKMAYDDYKDKNTLVMATPGTIQSERLLTLDKQYPQKDRKLLACPGLAELIENWESDKIEAYLKELFKDLDCKKVEVVVLGCTHYHFIMDAIRKVLGHSVIFLDERQGIANRAKELLVTNHLENKESSRGSLTFILTDPKTESTIAKCLNNIYD